LFYVLAFAGAAFMRLPSQYAMCGMSCVPGGTVMHCVCYRLMLPAASGAVMGSAGCCNCLAALLEGALWGKIFVRNSSLERLQILTHRQRRGASVWKKFFIGVHTTQHRNFSFVKMSNWSMPRTLCKIKFLRAVDFY